MANDNYNSEFILKNGWPCFDGLILNNLPCPKKFYLRLRIKEIKNPNVSVFCTPAFPPLFVSSLYFTDLFFFFVSEQINLHMKVWLIWWLEKHNMYYVLANFDVSKICRTHRSTFLQSLDGGIMMDIFVSKRNIVINVLYYTVSKTISFLMKLSWTPCIQMFASFLNYSN